MSERNPYKKAGVDVNAGGRFVEAIKPLAASTRIRGCVDALGGFGAAFDLKAAGLKDPILVSGTDGVGTKVLVAIRAGVHDTIGIDCVAMNANDVLCAGARPLFFLDYLATGKLDAARDTAILSGVAEGCRRAGCALIGGETAEMPGVYEEGDYDLAGFVVGAVERGREFSPQRVSPGMALVGLGSSGLHSNGFSLVRRLVFEEAGLDVDARVDVLGKTVGEELLTPTRIYAKLLPLFNKHGTAALAHITGGGIAGNLGRVIPPGLKAVVKRGSWPRQPVFAWLQGLGKLTAEEMERVFNCGLGLIACVPEDKAEALVADLAAAGEFAYRVGEVLPAREGEPRAVVVD
ncbi:MAG: phosphoribosylformylglycinamidine cyclo-ligase [bacterium]|nr:phosphoribosylformylglycinamidine cyclo-ligase [bacterium]